jgi:hypothetical protein
MDARTGVRQLQRLLISYCKHDGSSKGARLFIAEQLPKLQQEYPHLHIEVQVFKFVGPEYLQKCSHIFSYTIQEIEKMIS